MMDFIIVDSTFPKENTLVLNSYYNNMEICYYVLPRQETADLEYSISSSKSENTWLSLEY